MFLKWHPHLVVFIVASLEDYLIAFGEDDRTLNDCGSLDPVPVAFHSLVRVHDVKSIAVIKP
jgi:hypothetical protein